MFCLDFYRTFFAPSEKIRLIILIDGLGMNLLNRLPPENWLMRHCTGELRSVYPSTTAVALSCLGSLQNSGLLGVTGWTTRLPEFSQSFNLLPATRIPEDRKDTLLVEKTLLVPSAFNGPRFHIINPASYGDTGFQAWFRSQGANFRTYDEKSETETTAHWRTTTLKTIRDSRRGDLIYLYLPKVDSNSHLYGWRSPETRKVLDDYIVNIEMLTRELTDSPLEMAITADHGHIELESERYFPVNEETPWNAFLEAPFTGEGRNPVFHVQQGKEEDFTEAFQASPEGDYFTLVRPEDLTDPDFFGPEGISPEARPRWGNFVGIVRENAFLQNVNPLKERMIFRSAHGGNSPEERRVPLIEYQTGI